MVAVASAPPSREAGVSISGGDGGAYGDGSPAATAGVLSTSEAASSPLIA